MKIEINLSEEEEETAQRLCDEGIGTSSEEETNSIHDLVQWRISDYLRQKANMFLNSDRKKLSKEDVNSMLSKH